MACRIRSRSRSKQVRHGSGSSGRARCPPPMARVAPGSEALVLALLARRSPLEPGPPRPPGPAVRAPAPARDGVVDPACGESREPSADRPPKTPPSSVAHRRSAVGVAATVRRRGHVIASRAATPVTSETVPAEGRAPAGRRRERSQCQVDVRIGIIQTPKELEVELADDADREKVLADIEKALDRATACCGSPTAGAAGWACRWPRWPTSRWAPRPPSAGSASAPPDAGAAVPRPAGRRRGAGPRRSPRTCSISSWSSSPARAASARRRWPPRWPSWPPSRASGCWPAKSTPRATWPPSSRPRPTDFDRPGGGCPASSPCPWTPRRRCAST